MLKNYTTNKPVSATVREMQDILARAGASGILIQYKGGAPVSLSFIMPVGDQTVPVRVQPKVEPILKKLQLNTRLRREKRTPEHARSVAWRIWLDWLKVQLSLIEDRQADLAELLLGQTLTRSGRPFYAEITEQPEGRKLLAEKL